MPFTRPLAYLSSGSGPVIFRNQPCSKRVKYRSRAMLWSIQCKHAANTYRDSKGLGVTQNELQFHIVLEAPSGISSVLESTPGYLFHPCAFGASGVTKPRLRRRDGAYSCSMSDGGIVAVERGSSEPPRRLSGGRCGHYRSTECRARRRRDRQARRWPSRARCARRCAAATTERSRGRRSSARSRSDLRCASLLARARARRAAPARMTVPPRHR